METPHSAVLNIVGREFRLGSSWDQARGGSHHDLRHTLDRGGDPSFWVGGGTIALVTRGASTMQNTQNIALIAAVGFLAMVAALAYWAS
jgi:hypothetical protein